MEINNIYHGQYKVSREMNPSFEAYWGKYGVDSENNIVKNIIESIFDILYQDTKKTLIDAEKNNPIFDRLEYSKLINILHNLLNKYLNFNTTDTKDIQKKLKTNIKEQIQEIIDNYAKNLKSVVKEQKNEKLKITPIKKDLSKVFNSLLKVFFKQSQLNKKIIDNKKETKEIEQTSEKNNVNSNIEIFKSELSNQYKKTLIEDNGLVKDIKNTKIFKEYSLKMVKSVLRPSKTIQKISNNISKTTLKKIERVNKLAKSTPGFGLIKKIIEIRYKKEHQRITNVLAGEISKQEKEQIKNAKKISKHIDGLKSMYLMNLGFVFSTFGKVLKPVGGLLDGAKDVILHPLATLNKIFCNKWFSNILGQSLKNPATWYGLGFLTAKLWNRIEGPLYKYVLNPVTSFALKITDVFSGNSPLFGSNSIIGRALSTFSSIFQKNDGIDNPLFNMLLNIAKIINFEDVAGLKTVFSNISPYVLTYLNAIVSIALSGKLAYYRGAGMIQKLLLLATHSNSSTLGSLFETDGNGNIILKNLKEYKEKRKELVSVINNTFGDENSKLNKDGIEIQGKILQEYDDIQQDLLTTLELQNIRDRLANEDTKDSISEVEISRFKQESKYTDINSLWNHFSRIYKVNTFEELGLKHGRETQLEYLQFMINSRQRNAEKEISNLFNYEKLKEKYITKDTKLPVIRLKQEARTTTVDTDSGSFTTTELIFPKNEVAKLSPERVRYIPYGQTDNQPDAVWSLNGSNYYSRPNTKEPEGEIQLIQPQYDEGKIYSLPNHSSSNPSGSIPSDNNKPQGKKIGSGNSEPIHSSSNPINIQNSGIVKKPVSVRIPKDTPDEVYGENQELQQVSQYIQEKIYGYNFTMMENNLSVKNDTIKILENALVLDDIRRQTIKNQNNIIVNITNEKEIQDTDRGGIA